ncbi:NADPH-dependent FMN reductase [Maritimibacter dapengensis]|uniref:NAD(P)H-dependent oxidoreductase n=1 Tax=Maritimibacter dapengensis TaxID=2836868 RepID=A0ABS6T1C8_9RHOB|nr:NAD(P)H-dependent oxidoreductase [Maritimibacter dapengensis]MBV7379030.1 NAD(P)H-dependent oxidoreductase [Maritimibacter dapengensis]
MTTPKIALIIGSTRDARWADEPANWLLTQAKKRSDIEVELVDLRDFDLPLFNEAASNLWVPSQDPKAVAWQEKIAEFDGYVWLTAEYNHTMPAAMKNALDQAYNEWVKKPVTAFGYGSMGAVRSVEHLRQIAVELQMVPVRSALHLGGADFFAAHPMGAGKGIEAVEENLLPSASGMFDDLVWWAHATMSARAEDQAKAA